MRQASHPDDRVRAVPEIRNLTDLAAYAQDQVERIARMQQDLEAAVGEGESPRRLARARTGPGGRLLELHLSPDAMRLPAEEAAAEITAAVVAAQTDFAGRADDIMEPVLAMRPGEEATEALDQGMRRLDELTADLERLGRRSGLQSEG
jgi:YbaB/EbfC DNA-binding family